MNTPAENLCDRSWRVRNSAWLLGPILSVGLLTWASLWYVSRKTGRADWRRATQAFGVAGAVLFVSILTLGDGKKGTSTPGDTVGALIMMVVWISSIAYCVRANRPWLIWRAHHTGDAAWYATAAATPTPPPNPSGPSVDDVLLGSASTAWAPPPPPPPLLRPPPPRDAATTSAASPAGPIDANRSNAADLSVQLGLAPEAAQRLVAERTRIGGFTHVDQLMTVGGVPPHVFAGIRNRITLSPAAPPPPKAAPSGRGRRLDL
ncbi:helix-hairpin-helix domain-containing protein [Aquihabitans sp. G128]|uniref:ComEA family DNA-binding protein n=1 Tax=Aquihabitans sp. G128 TaxID=2849779 RepID=UPI001C230D30|nr:helix-hairpin-helix domain-containing protein [Aquihabitans sp. G128]QXC59909.1 helix-hairpin-helix domain-containing protein [Aquihabitans sp. G128]